MKFVRRNKEVCCSHCGTKGKVVFFKKLKDGNMLCKNCAKEFPRELKSFAFAETLQEYEEAKAYALRSKNEFEPIFNNNAGFHQFEVDSKNKLFRMVGSNLIFELGNIDFYNFMFKPQKAKSDVNLFLSVKAPFVIYDETVAFGVKQRTAELDSFIARFDRLCNMAKTEMVGC